MPVHSQLPLENFPLDGSLIPLQSNTIGSYQITRLNVEQEKFATTPNPSTMDTGTRLMISRIARKHYTKLWHSYRTYLPSGLHAQSSFSPSNTSIPAPTSSPQSTSALKNREQRHDRPYFSHPSFPPSFPPSPPFHHT